MGERVVIAMSGGVDSSVAALLLHQQGYEAIGVSMQVWDYRKNGGSFDKATCCAPSDFCDARAVSAQCGFPFYVFDFEESFGREVIAPFVEAYARGETPNPCIACNSRVKFGELRARARTFSAPLVATGHYAQVVLNETGPHLFRGVDDKKDQSYFLYGIKEEELRKTLFPIGGMDKDQVREIARAHGLATAHKPESQDICFVSGAVSDFLSGMGVKSQRGDIVTTKGRLVGHHEGIHNFTVGQRRGLRIGGTEEPLYVVELDPETQRVVVGGKADLERGEFYVARLNWIRPAGKHFRAVSQLRYRHRGVPVDVELLSSGCARVRFVSDWTAVSPGQAAVFYSLDNKEVLGGGGRFCAVVMSHRNVTALRRHRYEISDRWGFAG